MYFVLQVNHMNMLHKCKHIRKLFYLLLFFYENKRRLYPDMTQGIGGIFNIV